MMKLKLDDAGHVVVQDGKPVYVNADGSEVAFDAVGTTDAVKRLNGEAKGHRERAEAAEGKLKVFDGMDAAAARKAIDDISKIDQKKLIDAGEVDKVRGEITKSWEGKVAEKQAELEKLHGQLNSELIGGNFARSPVLVGDKRKVAMVPAVAQSYFGGNFKVEDGKTVGYDRQGNKIYSKANPGELAGFDEAIMSLVESDPNRDHIMLGNGASGSGAAHSSGGGKTMTLTEQHMAAKNR